MKSILIFFISVIISNSVFGQEPENSTAKIAFKGLNTSLENLKTISPQTNAYLTELTRAKRNLEKVEKYEPAFDLTKQKNEIAAYEDKLKVSQEEAEKLAADQIAARNDAYELKKEMEKLFKGPSLLDFPFENPDEFEMILEKYKTDCNAFVSNKAAERISNAKNYNFYEESDGLRYERRGFDLRIAELEKTVKESRNQTSIKQSYFILMKYEVYWSTLNKAMPEDKEIETNLNLIKVSINGLGNYDSMKDRAAKNEAEERKSIFMKDAVRKDAATESLFRKTFEAQNWNEEILKIHLRDEDWHIVVHPISGATLFRYQVAEIAAKQNSGDCMLYRFTIAQDYMDGKFLEKAYRSEHVNVYIDCGNITK